ncbi:MAG: class I SAM-dependent methyltransferase [Oscillospiraceae bacterium]
MDIKLKKEITGTILDVGGGGEAVIGRIYKEQVTAIDNEQQELDEAPDCCRKVMMDARSLEFQNESFENATAFYSFMYMSTETKEKAVAEISRVLKPGGRLYIWDAEVASAEKEPFLADLDIDAAGEKIETTYGIMGDNITQNAEYFIRLCSEKGLSLLEKSELGGHFHLVFEKTPGDL